MKTLQVYSATLLLCLITITSAANGYPMKEVTCPCTIVLKTNGGGIYPDYGLYVKEQLRELDLSIEVRIEEWTVFVGTLCLTHDFDIGIRRIDFSLLEPDPTSYFNMEDNTNPELLGFDIPYVSESYELLKQAQSISNQTERIQMYIEWSNLVMDKLAYIYPLFNQRNNQFLWSNTLGYEIRWGLAESLPHMRYEGYHNGQVSLDEFNLALPYWIDMNALSANEPGSELIIDLIYEPIIQVDPYTLLPINTGLIESWEVLNGTHYTFHLRDNIFWSPSFNTTGRTSSSPSLNSSDTSNLLIGLKGEYSNGTNQQLTAKDVVFSLLAYSNPLVSNKWTEYNWIKSIELDPFDEFSFNLEVDGNPNTLVQDFYAPLWSKLNVPCLPEFFLNSTSLSVTQSSSGINMTGIYEDIKYSDVWKIFRYSGFGCGKYQLDYYTHNSRTGLQANPNWHNISAIDGSTQFLNISKINILELSEESARKAEFTAGKLDFYNPIIPFDYSFDPMFIPQTSISNEVSCLFFNLRRPFIGGADNFVNSTYEGKEDYTIASTIRKAICYAINRNEINDELNHGWYTLQHGLINELFTHPYSDEIFDYEYDLDSAKEWLTGVRPTTTLPETPITTISYGIGFLYGIFACAILILSKIRKKKYML
ncbi:MAG: hypothetical protein GPJ51_07695 [Candidatus Heimdallarchaeota archaeon]|nr:hypothetical protein [Candidatus Heimdallarchaeota archaeon]